MQNTVNTIIYYVLGGQQINAWYAQEPQINSIYRTIIVHICLYK